MAEGTGTEEVREVDWSAFASLWRGDPDMASPPRWRAVSTLLAGVCWVVAFVLVFVTWSEVADRNNVADQLPWFASGGLSALLLSIMGGAFYLGGSRR